MLSGRVLAPGCICRGACWPPGAGGRVPGCCGLGGPPPFWLGGWLGRGAAGRAPEGVDAGAGDAMLLPRRSEAEVARQPRFPWDGGACWGCKDSGPILANHRLRVKNHPLLSTRTKGPRCYGCNPRAVLWRSRLQHVPLCSTANGTHERRESRERPSLCRLCVDPRCGCLASETCHRGRRGARAGTLTLCVRVR